LSGSKDGGVRRREISNTNDTLSGPVASKKLAPFALCIAAALTMAFTPVLVWHVNTGSWVCLNDWFTLYYLRFAAQAFYSHVPDFSDVVVPGGVTYYSWLQFMPAAYAARFFAATPFGVNLIWIFLSAIGLGTGFYAVFRHFLQRPWAAAGCTLFCLSDYGLDAARPVTAQLQMLASALWFHPTGLISIPWGLLLQWRVPDPGLNLPFICIQIVALARARERPSRLNVWLSGVAFGVLYYIFFYCWTIAFTGLCIAFLLDRAGRRVYGITLSIGSLIGLPQLIYSIHLNFRASAEAMRRFGMFVPAPRLSQVTVPTLSLLAMAAVALWILKSKRFELVYAWSLVAGGILLSRSRVVTGIFFHEYHYDWLWAPVRVMLVLITIVSILSTRFQWRPFAAWVFWSALMLYFAGGVYLAAICVTRTWSGADQLRNYMRYKSQRLAKGVKPLLPGSMIAGDEAFCELGGVAENQWVLSGEAVPRSLAADNNQWELRAALNAYVEGTGRAEFENAARIATTEWFWENPKLQPEVNAAFMRDYDEISRDPIRFIAEFAVRYVVLPADRAQTRYLHAGWTMLQRGPYWQIWEREKSQP
jgi:hypothetical protein